MKQKKTESIGRQHLREQSESPTVEPVNYRKNLTLPPIKAGSSASKFCFIDLLFESSSIQRTQIR